MKRNKDANGEVGVHDEENSDDNLPIDRGWAWVIVISTFFINFMTVGVYRSYGILFVEFLEEFNASKSVTSLFMGIYCAAYSATALLVMNVLIEKFSLRAICLVGASMFCLGGVLSYFAWNLEFMIFTQSFLPGIGSALTYGPGIVIVGQYFEKRRALAQAISSCGVSIGGMAVPQLVRYLLSQYGLRGTLLLSGGLLAQCFIFVLMYRPAPVRKHKVEEPEVPVKINLENFKKQLGVNDDFEVVSIESFNDSKVSIGNGHTDSEIQNGYKPNLSVAKMILNRNEPFRSRTESDPTAHNRRENGSHSESVPKEQFLKGSDPDLHNSKDLNNSMTSLPRENKRSSTLSPDLTPRHRRKHTSHSYLGSLVDTLSHTSHLKYASNADVYMMSTFSLAQPVAKEDEPTTKKQSICRKILNIFDFSVFKLPHFYLILGTNMLGVCAVSLFAAFLPAFGAENGLTDIEAALLITIYAGVDCVSRFLAGVVVETGMLKSHHVLALSMICLGTLYELTRLYTDFKLMVMFAVIFGMTSGPFPALNPVVMVDFIGIHNFPKALGFIQVLNGMVLSGVTPLLGALGDMTGAYYASYHLLGTCGILSGCVLLLEPLAMKLQKSKNDENDIDIEEKKALT